MAAAVRHAGRALLRRRPPGSSHMREGAEQRRGLHLLQQHSSPRLAAAASSAGLLPRPMGFSSSSSFQEGKNDEKNWRKRMASELMKEPTSGDDANQEIKYINELLATLKVTYNPEEKVKESQELRSLVQKKKQELVTLLLKEKGGNPDEEKEKMEELAAAARQLLDNLVPRTPWDVQTQLDALNNGFEVLAFWQFPLTIAIFILLCYR